MKSQINIFVTLLILSSLFVVTGNIALASTGSIVGEDGIPDTQSQTDSEVTQSTTETGEPERDSHYGLTPAEAEAVSNEGRFDYQDYLDQSDDGNVNPETISALADYSPAQLQMAADLNGNANEPLNDGSLYVDIADHFATRAGQADSFEERQEWAQKANELQQHVEEAWEPEESGMWWWKTSPWEEEGLDRGAYKINIQEEISTATTETKEAYLASLQDEYGVPDDYEEGASVDDQIQQQEDFVEAYNRNGLEGALQEQNDLRNLVGTESEGDTETEGETGSSVARGETSSEESSTSDPDETSDDSLRSASSVTTATEDFVDTIAERHDSDTPYVAQSWEDGGLDYFEAAGFISSEEADEIKESTRDIESNRERNQAIADQLDERLEGELGEITNQLLQEGLYVYDPDGDTSENDAILASLNPEEETSQEENNQQPTEEGDGGEGDGAAEPEEEGDEKEKYPEEEEEAEETGVNTKKPGANEGWSSIRSNEENNEKEGETEPQQIEDNPRQRFQNANTVYQTVKTEDGDVVRARFEWDSDEEGYYTRDGQELNLQTDTNYYYTSSVGNSYVVTHDGSDYKRNRVLTVSGRGGQDSANLQFIRSGIPSAQGRLPSEFSQGEYVVSVSDDGEIDVVSSTAYDEANGDMDKVETESIGSEQMARVFQVAYTDVNNQGVTLDVSGATDDSGEEQTGAAVDEDARYVVNPDDETQLFVIHDDSVEVRSTERDSEEARETEDLIAQTLYTESSRRNCVSGCGRVKTRNLDMPDQSQTIDEDSKIRYLTRDDGSREYVVESKDGTYTRLDGERHTDELISVKVASQDTISEGNSEYAVVDDEVYEVTTNEDGTVTSTQADDQTTEQVLEAERELREERAASVNQANRDREASIETQRGIYDEYRGKFLNGLGDIFSNYLHGYGREAADNYVRQACYDMMFGDEATGEMQIGNMFIEGFGSLGSYPEFSAPFSGGCQLLPKDENAIKTQQEENQEQFQEDLESCQDDAQDSYESSVNSCSSSDQNCLDSARETYYSDMQACRDDTQVEQVGTEATFGQIAGHGINPFSDQQVSCQPTNGMSSEQLDQTVFPGTTGIEIAGRKYNDASVLGDQATCSYTVAVKLSSLYPVRLAVLLQNGSATNNAKDHYVALSQAIGLYSGELDSSVSLNYDDSIDITGIRTTLGSTNNMSDYLMKNYYKLQPDPELSTNNLDSGNMSIYAHKYIETNVPCNFAHVCYYVMGPNVAIDPPYLCKRLASA